MKFLDSSNFEFEENSKYEILENMISIVEQLKNKKINFSITEDNKVDFKKSNRGYTIKLGLDHVGISSKTKLEKELAKIVFDSPIEEFNKLSTTIKTNGTMQTRGVFVNYLKIIFNYLESRRIESCYGYIYRGTHERFIEARIQEANTRSNELLIPNDPIEALKLAKYDKFDLVKKSDFAVAIDYIQAVEMTGKKGAIDLSIMYWKKVVEPFLNKKLGKNSQGQYYEKIKSLDDELQEVKDQKSQIQSEIEKIKQELPTIKEFGDKKLLENRMHQLILEYGDLDKEQNELKKQDYSLKQEVKESKESTDKKSMLKDFRESVKIYEDQKINFEKLTENLKLEGKKEIKIIEEKLEKISKNMLISEYNSPKIKKQIFEEKPELSNKVPFNRNIAEKLKLVFKKIQGGKQLEIDSVGDEIDVDSYIDFRIKKIGDFQVSSKNFVGFDIVIAIDESGSMKNDLDKVKRMCSTLYEAISGLPNVRLTIIGWSGDSNSCKIKKITTAAEIGSLTANWETPLGTAVWYCQHFMEKLSSQKRLFILITDGKPNRIKDVHLAREGVNIMKKNGIICNGICVGVDSEEYAQFMHSIFGSKFVVCDNFEHVDSLLRKSISEQIIRSIRMANHC